MIRINVPSELKEITLRQYQSYVKVLEQNPTVTQFLKHKTIEIFCGLELRTIDKLPKSDVDSMYDILINMLTQEKREFKQKFKFKGKKFAFHHNMYEGITSGEYADLCEYMKSEDTWHRGLAVIFRPIDVELKDGRYLIEKYEGSDKYSGIMLDLPMDIVLGGVFFFETLFSQLANDILTYLQNQMEINPEWKQSFTKNGDGTPVSISSVKEALLTLKKSLTLT